MPPRDASRLKIKFWLARSASALFRMGSKKRIGDPTRHGPAPLAPYVKFDHFWRNSLFENEQISTKLVKLGRTPYLKTDNFRRNFVKIGEIEAHSFFEN